MMYIYIYIYIERERERKRERKKGWDPSLFMFINLCNYIILGSIQSTYIYQIAQLTGAIEYTDRILADE